MRRTKIVCTMGPNTDKKTIMRAEKSYESAEKRKRGIRPTGCNSS